MTSNDAPHPGRTPRAGRRRALGRGPGAPAAAPLTAQTPSGDGASGTAGAAPAEQDLRAGSEALADLICLLEAARFLADWPLL
ncbi:hypothetical protein AB0L31_36230, partial [Streptomyces sp. NPDC052535]